MLSQGDSRSAAGWLAKSTFDDDCPMHLALARQFADFCITNDIVHYTQWFPGKKNNVANVLSRDFALNDEEVTKLIHNNCSPFVPQHFRIIPLQPTIISRIGDLLRRLPKTQLLPAQPVPSAIAVGAVTSVSSIASDSTSNLFSDNSDEPKKSKSSRASRPPFRGERLGAGQREGSCHGRKSGTICTTLNGVAQAFRLHKLESPIHDSAGRLEPVLALQLRGYADEDPDPRSQQALPLEVVKKVWAMRTTARDEAIGQLMVTAFFFAMRSCEYSDAGRGRITTVVTIDDVLFRKDGETIPTDDRDLTRLADTVSITFRKQKNQDNGTTITQHRNDRPGQADICPVRTLAELVARIRSYGQQPENANPGINVWTETTDDDTKYLSSTAVLEQLRTATRAIDERRLGFKAADIGTHSIRSGAAMAMYLAGVKLETIQMIGRWRSRLFMRYLRIQVPETTRGVATRMTSRHTFFTIDHKTADA